MGRLRKNSKAPEILKECKIYINNPEEYKGKWNKLFGNNNPIQIEIGCGKGRFIYQLAQLNPNINYIAIDKYDTVLLKLVKKEGIQNFSNLRVISIDANLIEDYFAKGEIDKIYLNFSDPWPKACHEKRRLTSPAFIQRYLNILKDKGLVEFKTDNIKLFDYTVEVLKEGNYEIMYLTYDLHNEKDVFNIMTEYEEKFSNQNFKINKLIFSPSVKLAK